MRSYLLVATALVLPVGGVLLERSMAVFAAPPAAVVASETGASGVDPRQPVDAGYAVPGVLDYRSWKPEYDRKPPAAAVALAHSRGRGVRSLPQTAVPVADDRALVEAAVTVLPREDEAVPAVGEAPGPSNAPPSPPQP